MTSVINTLRPAAPDLVCDFGWYYSGGQEMAEYFYVSGVSGDIFPVGASTLTSGVTLDPTTTATTTISIDGTQSTSVFGTVGRAMVQDSSMNWALVSYTGTTQTSGLTTSLTGARTLQTNTAAAVTFASGANVFDPRLFWTQTPLHQTITFDAIDNNNLGLPTVQIPTGIEIVRYAWDFGNGDTSTGPVATTMYNYSQAPPNVVAKLTITDSLNRQFSCTHPVNLQNFSPLFGFSVRS